MVRLFNPGGHDWGNYNLDGYGIGYIVFDIIYTIAFLAACAYVWIHRNDTIIKMRNIPLALSSLLLLHIYMFMVLIVYPINGAFPCQAEFWIMSLYLPIGIGLFQAQNQQLLIVSERQRDIVNHKEEFNPRLPDRKGLGSLSYWSLRFRFWWNKSSKENRFEMFVLMGIIVQFVVSLVLYNVSRRMNDYGIIGEAAGPGLCRRGWEWIPSIAWQCLWNFFFGPYLLWKIRMIRDIYHWRLQTMLSIIAGIPGTPLWLAGVYSDSFAPVNKYWVPAMWFTPCIMTMEITTLAFPIYLILKQQKNDQDYRVDLENFDAKIAGKKGLNSTSASMTTRSTGSKGKMETMEALEDHLNTQHDGLQIYASCSELCGENILFLRKVISFKKQWASVFGKRGANASKARMTMFRVALNVYVNLVDSNTAKYPINIESPIYHTLEEMFGAATKLVATRRKSTSTTSVSTVTPWDEPEDPFDTDKRRNTLNMRSISLRDLSDENESSEAIITPSEVSELSDPLSGFIVPGDFGPHVFDAAFKSIKYMVWSETWQRYMSFRRNSGFVD